MSIGLLFTACQDEYELGEVLPAESLQYEITQNPNDPNMVILESLTPNVTPLWTTPMGRSTRVKDTVRLPFEGTYKFVYGVQSNGGYVSGDTVVLNITTQNLTYVDDPLWDFLTGGGVGNEKSWLLDTDGKYFAGPLSFYGVDNAWLHEGGPWADGTQKTGCYGGDCWTWSPDTAWIYSNAMKSGDYGVMTFSLKGEASFNAVKPMEGGIEENGSYSLNVATKMLRINDASILRGYKPNNNGITGISDWSNYFLFDLNDDILRLGVVRDQDVDGEGAAMLVYNFISKEYSDNWVPEDVPDPEPPYDGDANSDLTTNVSTTKTWKVDLDYPYNWHDLAGTPLNEVATYGSDPEGFTFDSWTPPYDETVFSSISVELTKVGESDGTYVIQTETGEVTGNYTVNAKNEIDFGQPITFFSGVGGWLGFSTTAENKLRIIAAEKDAFGNVTGIWLGQKSADKDEYFSLHLKSVANTGGEPSGTVVPFDNAKLLVGDLEGNGKLRLELYNDFGATKANPPLDPTAVVFDNRIEITFTLQGITLINGAKGSYTAAIGLADADWSAQYWGGGPGDVTVTGNGTYTVYAEPGSSVETALVFVIDMPDMAPDIDDMGAVTATIDSIIMY
ncbi:hypothetical protein GCM10009122_01440 [Fulvivirga kasyanovii]